MRNPCTRRISDTGHLEHGNSKDKTKVRMRKESAYVEKNMQIMHS